MMLLKSISRCHPFSASARDCALHVRHSKPGIHLKQHGISVEEKRKL